MDVILPWGTFGDHLWDVQTWYRPHALNDDSNKEMISLICAAEALTNKGRFCLRHIRACQWGKLKV